MTLDYIALALLIAMVLLVVYGIVAVYGIPYEIARRRQHPHQDAILAATWVSLFTLGLLWPFLWIWALLYQPGQGWGFGSQAEAGRAALAQIDARLTALEQTQKHRVT